MAYFVTDYAWCRVFAHSPWLLSDGMTRQMAEAIKSEANLLIIDAN